MPHEVLPTDHLQPVSRQAQLDPVSRHADVVYGLLESYLRDKLTVCDLDLGTTDFDPDVLEGVAIGLRVTGVYVRFHRPDSGDVLNWLADIEMYVRP